jgi:hypothetical protein
LVGWVNGLFGGGGGMIAVPTMQSYLSFGKKCSHAAAICVIAPICILSSLSYIACGYAKANIILPCAIGYSIGGFCGAGLLINLSDSVIDWLFMSVMATAGIVMVVM